MMEAENKKKRDAAKKERNEEIRVREQLATVQRSTCFNFDSTLFLNGRLAYLLVATVVLAIETFTVKYGDKGHEQIQHE